MQKIKLRQTKVLYKPNNVKLFKGEENIDSLEIFIPTTYNNIDLSNCNVRLQYILSDGTESSFLIDEYKQSDLSENCFIYSIPIDKRFTSVSGKIEISLTITKSGNEILKSTSTCIYINEQPEGTTKITEEELDIIDQVVLISNKALKTAESVEQRADNLEQINADLVEDVSQLKGDLDDLSSSKITKFYASNLGETHITDSDNGKIQDMMIYGKSEQFSTSGAQLFDTSKIEQKTNNGITMSTDNDYVVISGTGTAGYIAFSIPCEIVSGTTVFLSVEGNYANLDFYLRDSSHNNLGLLKPSSEDGVLLSDDCSYFRIVAKAQAYNTKIKIMLSKTKGANWEPYTGGIPSPNPDYPQKIQGVVNPKVTVCGAQLQSKGGDNYNKNGITVNYVNGTEITIKGTATAKCSFGFYLVDIKKNTKYTLSLYGIDFTKINANLGYSGKLSNVSKTFNSGLHTKRFLGFAIEEGTTVDCTFKLMLNEGSTALPYEPYKEQVVTLPYTLNAIPVTDGGNVTIDGQQYLADYVDVERGKLVKIIDEKQIKRVSIGNYADYVNGTLKRAVCDFQDVNYSTKWVMINAFRTISSGVELNACRMYKNDTLFMFVNAETYPTAEDFNNYLAENTVIARFILETPTEIDLTDEEVKSFKELATYYPHTNVMVTSEQLDGYTTFNYPISMANGWNYVKEQLGDTRDYIYDMELQSAEAYVNSEYAVALSELEV